MSTENQTQTATIRTKQSDTPVYREPLQLKGVLDQFKSFDVTPVIGREFVDVNLKDLLRASNSDELIRDLAITSELIILMIALLKLMDDISLPTRRSVLP
jgi:hypothetical protein